MYNIKPGRGPSMGGGFMSIFAAIFGVFWTIGATSMGAPSMFTAFGVIFIMAAIGSAIFNFYNATSKNRFSTFEVTRSNDEPDPLSPKRTSSGVPPANRTSFCPYCGTSLKEDYKFCPKCGKNI
ncbi:zinc ribbon domain-containing protein [Rubritalea spongiae]|uniref:Zinc ribbon domain-containing protein n=1 Tax=Rubritalea spongiae TaxID=430797 RepID=A0ABW5E1U7_9BACT